MSAQQNMALFLAMSRSTNSTHKKLDRYLGAVHGLGVSDFRVLRELNQAPNNSLSRIILADSIGLTASGITRLLNPMEKIGLVEKLQDKRDARVSLVRLSAAGKQKFNDSLDGFNHVMESTTGQLTESETLRLTDVLEKIP